MKLTFKTVWQTQFERDKVFYEKYSDDDLFGNWEQNTGPEAFADMELFYAFNIICGGGKFTLAKTFLDRCIRVVDKAMLENKFQSKICSSAFPYNRARSLRARTYANAISTNKIDSAQLLQASFDYEEWSSDGGTDAHVESERLAAIRTAMIAGDSERAKTLLSALRIRWHKEEFAILDAITKGKFSEVRQQAMEFFDRIRNPDFKPDMFTETEILRLELGYLILRNDNPNGNVDWREVCKFISA